MPTSSKCRSIRQLKFTCRRYTSPHSSRHAVLARIALSTAASTPSRTTELRTSRPTLASQTNRKNVAQMSRSEADKNVIRALAATNRLQPLPPNMFSFRTVSPALCPELSVDREPNRKRNPRARRKQSVRVLRWSRRASNLLNPALWIP